MAQLVAKNSLNLFSFDMTSHFLNLENYIFTGIQILIATSDNFISGLQTVKNFYNSVIILSGFNNYFISNPVIPFLFGNINEFTVFIILHVVYRQTECFIVGVVFNLYISNHIRTKNNIF